MFSASGKIASAPASRYSLARATAPSIPSVAAACGVVRKQKDAAWGPILEAAVVILKHADSYVAVAAHFHADKESGKLVLQPMAIVPVTGKTMELVWAGETSPPPKAKTAPAPGAPPAHAK